MKLKREFQQGRATTANLRASTRRCPDGRCKVLGAYTRGVLRSPDVWPLAPDGAVLVVIMREEKGTIDNLPKMLEEVPGIGVVLIGEGDLSQDLGHPRQYDHPTVACAIGDVVAICKQYNVPCGHPHVSTKNVQTVLAEGFRWLMAAPTLSFEALEEGRRITGR